jgi:hypothetical protein
MRKGEAMKVQVKCNRCDWEGYIHLSHGELDGWVRYCPWCDGKLTKEDVTDG